MRSSSRASLVQNGTASTAASARFTALRSSGALTRSSRVCSARSFRNAFSASAVRRAETALETVPF